jgi:hypothetical protein
MGALTRDVPAAAPPPRANVPLSPPEAKRDDQFAGIEQYAAEPHTDTQARADHAEKARTASTAPLVDQPAPPPSVASTEGAVPFEPVVPAALSSEPERRNRRGVFVVAAIALIGLSVIVWRVSRPEDANQTLPAAATPDQPVAPAPAPSASQTPPPTPPAELTTIRRVWVRVTVDGDRVLERELEGNVRIQLAPKRQIVIRAGDAGAVRLSIAGEDQGVLGQDGFPATKMFTLKGQ